MYQMLFDVHCRLYLCWGIVGALPSQYVHGFDSQLDETTKIIFADFCKR